MEAKRRARAGTVRALPDLSIAELHPGAADGVQGGFKNMEGLDSETEVIELSRRKTRTQGL
jgi:hypothetical protein